MSKGDHVSQSTRPSASLVEARVVAKLMLPLALVAVKDGWSVLGGVVVGMALLAWLDWFLADREARRVYQESANAQ